MPLMDPQDQQSMDEEIETILLDRLNSGPSEQMTDEDFDRSRARLNADLAQDDHEKLNGIP